MPILTRCTHCRAKYNVSSSAVGKSAKCAKCGERFTVAESPAESAATARTVKPSSPPPAKPAAAPPKVAAAASRPAQSPSAKQPVAKAVAVPPPAKKPTAGSASAATNKAAPALQSKTALLPAKFRGRLTERELLASFSKGFQRRRPGIAYQLGILLVAVTMIILPLIYLAFIGLVGYGVYYHAVNNTGIMSSAHGRAAAVALGVYLAPIVAGVIAIFFMFKPLLAPPGSAERSRSLTRQSEPLLFAFVDRLCEVVGAPTPSRIDVDCNVNASASFRRGLLSMFGNDLVLTIGLPLAGGLTLREFGGVLAHEFGHFTQGLGMRLSYVIRSIVHWFVRVVYQRDQWDEYLDAAIEELDIRVGWVLLVGKLCVLIGRGILWLLLHIGLAISGMLLRQMEFDADRCETLFAGSDAFASTARKLHLLNNAAQFSHLQLGASLDRKELVSDLPGLIAYHVRHVDPEIWQKIDEEIAETRTGWFDSHPCDHDRIASAKKLDSTGIFQSDRSASELFANFRAQTEAATWDMYLGIFGPKVPRTALVPIEKFVADSKVIAH